MTRPEVLVWLSRVKRSPCKPLKVNFETIYALEELLDDRPAWCKQNGLSEGSTVKFRGVTISWDPKLG